MPGLWFHLVRTGRADLAAPLETLPLWSTPSSCSAGASSQLAPTFVKVKDKAQALGGYFLSPHAHIQKFLSKLVHSQAMVVHT